MNLDLFFSDKIDKRDTSCRECNKSFRSYSSLRVHVKQKHPDKLDELAPIKKTNCKCNICGDEFKFQKHLVEHKKSHRMKSYMRSVKCSLCQHEVASEDILRQHYTEDHSIEIITRTLEFDSMESFQAWKSATEAETFASFVKRAGSQKTRQHIRTTYICHRSGDFKTKGNQLRKLKTQGSNKIGGYCPARITVFIKENECIVKYCETHVGHGQEEDVEHLFLTKNQRETIASKISAKVPLPTILDEIKDQIREENSIPKRIHLLTKKDLYNIKSSCILKGSPVCNTNDDLSAKELKESDSIVSNNAQDSSCEEYSNDDFTFDIMTQDEELQVKNSPTSIGEQYIEEKKNQLFETLNMIQQELLNSTSLSEIEILENLLAPVLPTLTAVRNQQQNE